MERGYHCCYQNPEFNEKFKILYDRGDMMLFHNKYLQYQINNEIDAQQSIKAFI